MNPNNDTIRLSKTDLPIPVGQNLPVPIDSKSNLPVKVDISPEDMSKALQLRHENRLTVKDQTLPEVVTPLLGDGGQEPYKEPIRLNFDDEIEPGKRRMHSGASGRLLGRAVGAVIATAAMAAHQKVHEVENENSAVKGAHKAELITEHSVRSAARSYNRKRARQRNQLRDEPQYTRQKRSQSYHDESSSQSHSNSHGEKGKDVKRENRRHQQRAQIKKEYQIAARSKVRGTAPAASKSAKAAVGKADKIKELVSTFFKNNKGLFYVLAGLGVLLLLMLIGLGSCSSMFAGVSTPMITTTYPSTDEDIYAVEDAYAELESALDEQVGRVRENYLGYTSYNYDLDNISHNPYHLVSYFSVKYGNFTYNDVKTELQEIFRQQYSLSLYSTSERIEYTETVYEGDPPVAVEVVRYRTIYHLHIDLANHGLDTVFRSRMTAEETELYDLYNMTYGNRGDLFDLSGIS